MNIDFSLDKSHEPLHPLTQEFKNLSQIQYEELKYLAMELDPFDPSDFTSEKLLILQKYNLAEYKSDPFALTKNLLRVIDSLEAKISLHADE
jgi:hypothetical protein